MNHHAMEALYNERLNDIEHIINIQSGDDPDLKQEGLIGAYLALRGQPTATDQYLLNKSRWDMVSSIRKGKSVDNGFYKRKNLRVVRYNQLPADDKVFSAFIHEYGHEPVDEKAIYGAIKKLREDGFCGECLTHAYIKDCIERFKTVHQPIARFLHMGLGIKLQYYDSLVMDEVLMRMVSKKIPALPVHDSVICPAEHEAILREVMEQSYEKIIGKGFKPVITKK